MSLSCGGRGPCCHIGYAHRHCEHCDVVIATTVQPHYHGAYYGNPWWNQTYQGGLLSGLNSGIATQLQQLANGLASPGQYNVTEVPIDAGQQSSST